VANELADVANDVPESLLPPGGRRQLAAGLRRLDRLGSIEGSTVYLRERAVREILRAAFPPASV
jgi:hypothetical protein